MSGETRTILVEAPAHGRVIVRPARTPQGLLLGFHGYMESAEIQMQRLLEIPSLDSWTLVSVQGLNRFYRGRSEEVVAGWMTRQDREAAIDDNIAYVTRVIGETRAANEPIACVGFSQGVAMAFRCAVRAPSRAAAVVAVGGPIPPELLEDRSASFPRALLARGDRDDWYIASKLDSDASALQARRVRVETHVYDGAHEWTAAVSAAAGRFLQAAVDPPDSATLPAR